MKIFCPRCQTNRVVRTRPDDTRAPCPACGLQVTLARSEQPLAERIGQSTLEAEIVVPETAIAAPKPVAVVPYPHHQPRRKRGLPVGLMIAGGICLLLMITVGALAAVWLSQPRENEAVASTDTPESDLNTSNSGQGGNTNPDPPEPPNSSDRSPAGSHSSAGPGRTGLAELIEQVRPSLVHLSVRGVSVDDDGKLVAGSWTGSGFLVDEDGTIVTNHHVVENGKVATATLSDGTQLKVLGFVFVSKEKDIAVLKLEDGFSDFQALELAPQLPRTGDDVFALGSPRGFTGSATRGVVSGVRTSGELQEMGMLDYEGKWIQTDTPTSPGNSGGPLLNMDGHVVGANTWGRTDGQNLNFAISSDDIKDAVSRASSTTQEIDQLVSPEVVRAIRSRGIR
ncbi:MAG: trypsin-like peptidase domain-containing protein [Planctomycetota bacterium]|nr:trypsin-like peptidase domain-containing protein [Planctomycetota bacterium]